MNWKFKGALTQGLATLTNWQQTMMAVASTTNMPTTATEIASTTSTETAYVTNGKSWVASIQQDAITCLMPPTPASATMLKQTMIAQEIA